MECSLDPESEMTIYIKSDQVTILLLIASLFFFKLNYIKRKKRRLAQF